MSEIDILIEERDAELAELSKQIRDATGERRMELIWQQENVRQKYLELIKETDEYKNGLKSINSALRVRFINRTQSNP